jgi:pyruvate/2-oxoglutarate/acetoin dehydrogenase E1 component
MAVKGWYYAQLEAIRHEMRERDDMFFLYELTAPRAVGPDDVINLEQEFGRLRVYNTSINEMWYASAAVGAGMVGAPVVAYIPYQGGTVAFDVLRQHAGKIRYKTGGRVGLPIVFFTEESGQSPTIGSQHSDWDEDIYYAHMPGIKVVVPSTVYDAKGFMHAAIRDPDPVVYINGGRLKAQADDVPDEPYEVPFGEAAIRRDGSDLTIVGYGSVMPYVMDVADELEAQGASAEVIDLRTLFPLDRETLVASATRTGRLLAVEPGKYSYGVGAEVIASISERVPGTVFRRLAYSDTPPPAAPEMFNWMQVTPARIAAAAQALLEA